MPERLPRGAPAARYLEWMAARGMAPATIDVGLSAIAHTHLAAGHESPRTFRLVQEVRSRLRGEAPGPNAKATVLEPELRRMVTKLPKSLAGQRDRALLLFGYATRFQRAELCAVDVEAITFTKTGLDVELARRGTLPVSAHEKDPALCPVRALRAWLSSAGITSGPVFRSIDRWNTLGGRIDGRTVARIVQGAAKAAGLDPSAFAAESIRTPIPPTTTPAAEPEAPARVSRPRGKADLLYDALTERGFPHLRVRRALKALGPGVEARSLEDLTREALAILAKPQR